MIEPIGKLSVAPPALLIPCLTAIQAFFKEPFLVHNSTLSPVASISPLLLANPLTILELSGGI